MTQFAFLQTEFPEVFEAAAKAELIATTDARGSCFHARLALEVMVKWMYANDRTLKQPYDTALSALIHEPSFRAVVGNALVTKARIIKDYGNAAAHDTRETPPAHAVTSVRELFHLCFWLTRTYARGARPDAGLSFNPAALPRAVLVEASTLAGLQALAREREAAEARLAEERKAREDSEAERDATAAELARVQAEIAAIKAANTAIPDRHDYGEDETRDVFIDHMLREAGWPLDQARDREFPVTGMPNTTGQGFVDYVLWGDDGRPLAVVEAKRTRRDPRVGQQQAKLYADCLAAQFGVRPLIFYTNGHEHWLWDDERYPPRAVSGFLKKDELELWRQRGAARKALAATSIDAGIVNRHYQTRAIRKIGEAFETDRERKALLVMATGSGKTRTVIALVDQLMRAGWVKRVLFLADRVALVKQAHNNFKKHLPSAPSANLQQAHDPKKNDHSGARVCLCTYPTMLNLIDKRDGGQLRYGTGHFDLIVIDEAHRSVYRRYRGIFAYFDSLLVGLTATPRDEIDRDTYSLFELERGVPTDAYDLDQAVADSYLVPPRALSVPLRFVREGIRYDQLSDEDKAKWDELEWEEKLPGGDIDPAALNKWLFNADTVDKVLEHLMRFGIKVEGGDRLGKTIIFAKNHQHAAFIQQRFDASYPHLAGHFARVVDYSIQNADSLIESFEKPDSDPHIAISVDMLDTGIDVPEVVNLVFFKIVRSKTKFWQMIGRGTRLRPDLFGPGQHKSEFLIFDFCQNFEFFNQNPDVRDGAAGHSLSQKLFTARVQIAGAIQDMPEGAQVDDLVRLNAETRVRLFDEVAGMTLDNFLVRAKRRQVERFQSMAAWGDLSAEDRETLIDDVAGLPTALVDDDTAAKQFDLIVLTGQLALLQNDASFARCKEKVMAIAARLEALANVPMVAAAMATILEVQTDAFWQDVDAWSLEQVRRRLRDLIKLIEGEARLIVYTAFEDVIGEATEVALPDSSIGTDRARFEMKAQAFLRQHLDHITIQKLRRNEQLTPQDLSELERILVEQVGVTPDELQVAVADGGGLGLFVRSLVGLERDAAKAAFAGFIAGKNLTGNQLTFINLIIDHLTHKGAMDPRRLYESPFTDLDDQGVSGVFPMQADVARIVQVLHQVRGRAAA